MKQEKKGKQIVAPIVILLLIGIYYVFFFWLICFEVKMAWVLRLLFGVIPLALLGVIIYVTVERIREIRRGEEDDLSQY